MPCHVRPSAEKAQSSARANQGVPYGTVPVKRHRGSRDTHETGKKTPGGAGTHTGHTGAHRSYRVQYRMRHGALRQAPTRAMGMMQMMQAMGLPAAFTSNAARQAEREAQEEAQEARVQATWARFNPYK